VQAKIVLYKILTILLLIEKADSCHKNNVIMVYLHVRPIIELSLKNVFLSIKNIYNIFSGKYEKNKYLMTYEKAIKFFKEVKKKLLVQNFTLYHFIYLCFIQFAPGRARTYQKSPYSGCQLGGIPHAVL
jgi:hypothetical protein